MKKLLKLIVISLLLFSFLVPYTAFAETGEIDAEWQDIELTEEERNAYLANNPNNAVSTYATGLISSYLISASKSGSNLIITGITRGATGVKRCGFTKVTIEVRYNSTAPWSTYKTYTDLYDDSVIYILDKSIAVRSGQYRVTCTHYAKKNILSTEKINNTSNTVII